jgi:hypothetical protein
MASTYVNDLRLNEMATGDGSGTWGTTTNTNLELIGEAFSYGTEGITTNADTHSTTIADGATDPGRSLYIKYTGALDSTCTVSLLPNTISKLWIIENATSGGFNLSIKQGSGAEIVIPSGDVKVVYSDGAGTGAAIFDALVDLNVATKLTIKNPATSASPATLLLQTGDTAVVATDVLGKIQFQAPDETGADAILVAAAIEAVATGTFAAAANATKLSFKTAASEAATEKMSLSSGGNLTLPTDAAILKFGADQDVLLTHVADSGLAMSVTGNNVAQLSVTQDKDDTSTGPVFNLNRYSAEPGDNDGGGIIQFNMENSADELFNAAQIYAVATDITDGTEDGKLIINTMKAGTATAALTISELGTATFGGNIVIPDDGTIGSTSDTNAIAIRSDGNVGINSAGSDTGKLYIYDNSTTDQLISLHQDHASNAQIAVQITHDGTGTGLYAQVNAGTGASVYGYNNSSSGGIATRGHSVASFGGYFVTGNSSSVGCGGFAAVTSNYGYLGYSTHGIFGSSVYCIGAMYKGSGTFRIPHPLKSEVEGEDWDLLHSFVEGPQCDLIYRGRATLVDGRATVSMDTKYGMTAGTFAWLTKDIQTFTSNETGWDAVKSSFSGDTITIECQNTSSTDTISWMVVAERDDPNIKASEITDDDGNLIIERPSEPPPPGPPTDLDSSPEV